jgi:hypothetical protein
MRPHWRLWRICDGSPFWWDCGSESRAAERGGNVFARCQRGDGCPASTEEAAAERSGLIMAAIGRRSWWFSGHMRSRKDMVNHFTSIPPRQRSAHFVQPWLGVRDLRDRANRKRTRRPFQCQLAAAYKLMGS